MSGVFITADRDVRRTIMGTKGKERGRRREATALQTVLVGAH
jgi:hypothetical protein